VSNEDEFRFPGTAAVAVVPQVTLCSRHGQAVAKRVTARLESSPPPWSYVLLILGALPFIIVVLAMARRLRVDGWPVCADCVSLRRKRLALGWLGLLAIPALCILGTQILPDESWSVLVMVAFLVLLFVGTVIVFGLAEYRRIARAT